ncbi:hypothetical protein BCR34DRAFT_594966 [Clohesyomyces aquaticus]|uniref:Uncharacterized protein n=1 Tax=Clohesyomyces aquaticus TaxID=1231657 RepID=A0A1Y1Y1X0_9PLEO|nr:hypothetical protein BCR34DRAFT_594966 [Clohesyomyces aquaticus]
MLRGVPDGAGSLSLLGLSVPEGIGPHQTNEPITPMSHATNSGIVAKVTRVHLLETGNSDISTRILKRACFETLRPAICEAGAKTSLDTSPRSPETPLARSFESKRTIERILIGSRYSRKAINQLNPLTIPRNLSATFCAVYRSWASTTSRLIPALHIKRYCKHLNSRFPKLRAFHLFTILEIPIFPSAY